MKKIKVLGSCALLVTMLWTGSRVFAQSGQAPPVVSCGAETVRNLLKEKNPDFDRQLQLQEHKIQEKLAAKQNNNVLAKPTGAPYDVDVVFHIVLTAAQITQLGGPTGIQQRVTSQMEVLNRDWNAKNADSVNIPAPFKPLFGNMNVRFRLATKTPTGQATPGYEIITTTKTESSLSGGNTGSTILSDAKYSSNGGANAWDPDKYYNVWVVNLKNPSDPPGTITLGIATPPRYPPWDQFPVAEQGTAIHYGTFGKRTSPSQYFIDPGADEGRTLVHETGHFFNLFHIWGNTDDCSDDDGVNDTPLQGAANFSTSPTFPKLDACSNVSPGVMYMNYMDYAREESQAMFSKGQVARSHIELDPGGGRYPLTQHGSGTGIDDLPEGAAFTLFPNPADAAVNLVFEKPQNLTQVLVVNLVGQVQKNITVEKNVSSLSLDLEGLSAGIYIVKCNIKNTDRSIVRKLVIQR